MHEMAIATELIDQVVEIARQNGAERVDEVQVEVGELRQVVPEAMLLAWEAVRDGTPAARASLSIEEVKASAECRRCEALFKPEILCFVCPSCGQADVRIVEGNDIVLKSLVLETDG